VSSRDIETTLMPALLLLLRTQRHARLMQTADGGTSKDGSTLLQGVTAAEMTHLLRRLLNGTGGGAKSMRAAAIALLLELLSSPPYPLTLNAPDSGTGGGMSGGGNNIRKVDEEWARMLHLCVLGYKFARQHRGEGCSTDTASSTSRAPSLLSRLLHWILHCSSQPLAHGLCAAMVRGDGAAAMVRGDGAVYSAAGPIGAVAMGAAMAAVGANGGSNLAQELVALHYSSADQRALTIGSSAEDETGRQLPLFVLNSVLVTLLPHLLGLRTGYDPRHGQSKEWAAVLAYSVPELLALLPLPLPLAAGLWQREGAALAKSSGAHARQRASASALLVAKTMDPSFVRANEVLALLLRQLWAGKSPAQHVPLLRRLLAQREGETSE
jgi:hypothetical protein